MRTFAPVPRRTEQDLRAALARLERHAPAADEVMAAVRAAQSPRAGRRPRWARAVVLSRWAAQPWLTVGAAVAAVAAAATGLTTALLPDPADSPVRATSTAGEDGSAAGAIWNAGSPQFGMRQPVSMFDRRKPSPLWAAPPLPPAAQVGKAMLVAASTASSDVLYTTETYLTDSAITQRRQDWSWPLQPVPGQRARWRGAVSMRATSGGPIRPVQDVGLDYTAPRAGASYAAGRLTVVCYPGASPSGCGYGRTQTPAGTWSVHNGRFVNPGHGLRDLSPVLLGRDITAGNWQVTSHQVAERQQTIELSETLVGAARPLPVRLWVDARTYLPQQMTLGPATKVIQVAWHYLQPTTATLAMLRVPVPGGLPAQRHPPLMSITGPRHPGTAPAPVPMSVQASPDTGPARFTARRPPARPGGHRTRGKRGCSGPG